MSTEQKTKEGPAEHGTPVDGEGLADVARERLEKAKDSLEDAADETAETVRRVETQLEDLVKSHPLASLLVAAGLSVTIGALIGYRLTKD